MVAIHAAVGDQRGCAKISDRRDDDQNHVGSNGTNVEMYPLDDLMNVPRVTVLKIDVEGYEVGVLRGAKALLERTDIVYCELSPTNAARFGNHPTQAEAVLKDAGFSLLRRQGDTWHAIDEIFNQLAERDQPRTGYNLVAVRREALPVFAARIQDRSQTLSW